ncbi:right-handed parallel beta-helix repeat-containing protein [Mucilaginibacter sp. dw_454]|uniref:right-handed parallel beta-helix repeat-containing protein n=1 Tax=Mucilaginibacter sp. dw_454 TaxID=2720079 RepID=UPI001BD69C51|nr:right-handed parallel beta-helix repeat-containing protein [Mucilaginibacter sp. dw_454]
MKLFCCLLVLLISRLSYGQGQRIKSQGEINYYIDPIKGNDHNKGIQKTAPWRSFAPANKINFSAGDRLIILSPGSFHNSLVLTGTGTAKQPIQVIFAPGQYDFYDTGAYKTKLAISNTNDVPDGLKAIALYIVNAHHVQLRAKGAKLMLHAKMIETCVDHSEDVAITGISYDYNTPTVSEFKVTSLQQNYADLAVNIKTKYSIKDSLLNFEGDGWQYQASWYWQEYDPATSYVSRKDLSLDKARFAETGPNKIRVYFPANPGFKQGFIYQTRDVTRDCTGIFMQRSKNVSLKNIRIYFMHGMGVVSQFCQNIDIDSVVVKPDTATGRTCAAWADILHFSSCRGLINIRNSYLSGANDDAVNVHGVHLRIMEKVSSNQLKVRFMHGQTYGFNPYVPGDSIELVHGSSLLSFANNVIVSSQMLNDKDVLITLKNPVSDALLNDDAIENTTWTPQVHIQNTTITGIPTRGILVTTRRAVVIEHNNFLRTGSAGVLVEDDAEGWYESGMVKSLTIINNNFYKCGEPAIGIHPENTRNDGPVHQNITINGNKFTLNGNQALAAKSTANISFTNNILYTPIAGNQFTNFKDCTAITLSNNRIMVQK